jgi:dTDP-4-amino-4,6-dideoxygalactose transaminase
MSNVLAALGASQIKRLDDMNRRRREHAEGYTDDLKELEGLELPIEAAKTQHSWQMYTVRLRERDRTGFLTALRESGIGASVHFDPPVHRQPYYEAMFKRRTDLRVTEQVASSIVTLPLWPAMTTAQRAHVATCVRTVL